MLPKRLYTLSGMLCFCMLWSVTRLLRFISSVLSVSFCSHSIFVRDTLPFLLLYLSEAILVCFHILNLTGWSTASLIIVNLTSKVGFPSHSIFCWGYSTFLNIVPSKRNSGIIRIPHFVGGTPMRCSQRSVVFFLHTLYLRSTGVSPLFCSYERLYWLLSKH